MATSLHAQHDRELFNSIADKYFAKDLAASSCQARGQRLFQTLRAVPMDPDTSVLEVGCGAGFTARYLEGTCDNYCGVDYAEQLVAYAERHNGRQGVRFVADNIMDFQPPEPFDVALMIGVLHHFDNIAETLQHVVSLVRPGGWVVANEPHPGNPLVHIARGLRKRTDANYSSDQCELTGDELHSLYIQAGLVDVRIQPQGLFSTPFAEVVLPPQWLTSRVSRLACGTDTLLEGTLGQHLHCLSWNLVAAGRRLR